MAKLKATAYNTITGCSQTVVLDVLISENMDVVFSHTKQICKGDTAHIHARVIGGTPPYTYNWTPAIGLSNSHIDSPIASPNYSTWYTLTVTDFIGCVTVDSVEVKVHNETDLYLPQNLTFAELKVGQSNIADSIMLVNNGIEAIIIDDFTIAAPFTISSPTVPTTVMPGETLSVSIIFNPQKAGAYSANLIIKGSPCNWEKTVQINAKADTLLFTQDIAYINFGKFKSCEAFDIDTMITITNTEPAKSSWTLQVQGLYRL